MKASRQQLGPGDHQLGAAYLRGALGALAAEWVGASLGWPLELRLAAALTMAALCGGPGIAADALTPGKLSLGSPLLLGLCTLAAVSIPGLWLLLSRGQELTPWAQDLTATKSLLQGPQFWVLVLAGPVTEELVHRGIIQRGLSRALGAGPAGLLSAAGFTAAHSLAGVPPGPHHFLAGLALAAAAERSGGWWTPALLHAAGNAGWVLATSLNS